MIFKSAISILQLHIKQERTKEITMDRFLHTLLSITIRGRWAEHDSSIVKHTSASSTPPQGEHMGCNASGCDKQLLVSRDGPGCTAQQGVAKGRGNTSVWFPGS